MYQQLRWVHVAMPLVDHYHQSNNQKPPPRPATATMRFAITHHTNRSIPLATRAAIASLFSRKSSNPLWLTMTSMKVLQSPHRQWWEVLIAVVDCNCGYYDFSSLICLVLDSFFCFFLIFQSIDFKFDVFVALWCWWRCHWLKLQISHIWRKRKFAS